MKKTLITRIVFVVGIILLLILQFLWSMNTYDSTSKALIDNSKISFVNAVSKEVFTRVTKNKIKYQRAEKLPDKTSNSVVRKVTDPLDIAIIINDLLSKDGDSLNIGSLDSIFKENMRQNWGVIPLHTIRQVSSNKRISAFVNTKSLVQIFTKHHQSIIVVKCGSNQWLELVLTNPAIEIYKKAKLLFFLSILIILAISMILLVQFRNMQHDRKFVKFLVDYTRMLAHDLKTPISGAQMLVSNVIRKTSLPAEPKQAMLEQSVELMGKTLMNLDVLLYLAKSEHATIPVNKIPVNLSLFIESIVGVYKARDYAPKQVAFDCNIPDNVTIMLDKVLMENVLVNLLDNAIKYSGIETRIQMTVEKNAKELKLRIQDNGYGISPENQKHIFEIFERGAATENPSLPGFGLGLHFVQKAIQAHGGKVVVKSEVGTGTEFNIVLPLE